MSHGAMTPEVAAFYEAHLKLPPQMEALRAVKAEMDRQVAKWDEQNHPSYDNIDVIGVLENAANLDIPDTLTNYAKSMCDKRLGMGLCSWQDILNEELFEARDEAISGNYGALKVELIQVAAVALSWYMSVERNGK